MGSTNILDMNNRISALEQEAGGGSTADSAKRSDIATEFNTTTTYTKGVLVYHEGKLYQFDEEHAAGAWIGTDAHETNVSDAIMESGGGGGTVIATAVSTGVETYESLLDTFYTLMGTNQAIEVDGLLFRQVADKQFCAVSEQNSSIILSVLTIKESGSTYDFWNGSWVRNAKGSYGTTAGQSIKLIQY